MANLIKRRRARPTSLEVLQRDCPKCRRKRVQMTIAVYEELREELWHCPACGKTSRFSY